MSSSIYHTGYRSLVLACVFILGIHSSCDNKEENLPPRIIVETPYANMQVGLGDTLHVKASITDETNVTKVRVQIVDGENVPVGPAQDISAGIKDFQLDTWYIIPPDLDTGEGFQLLIRAYDDLEYKNKYIPLIINFPPRVQKGILLIMPSSSVQYNKVVLVDTNMQQRILWLTGGDPGPSALWEEEQLLAVAGDIFGGVDVLSLEDSNMAWSIAGLPHPPYSFVTGLAEAGNMLWVGFQSGYINAYNARGFQSVATPSSTEYIPEQFVGHKDALVAYWSKRVGSGGKIFWHYLLSGALKYSTPFPHECSSLDVRNNTLYVFGNDDGEGRIWRDNNGTLVGVCQFPQEYLRMGVSVDENSFVVAMDNEVRFEDDNGSYTVIPNVSADNMVYDDIANMVLVSEGNNLYIVSLGGQPHQTIQMSDSIISIHPWYSR